jgi:hypothetical protein
MGKLPDGCPAADTIGPADLHALCRQRLGQRPPRPVVIGSLPDTAPNTDPVVSPQWAVRQGLTYFLQDNMARGGSAELFSFLATNNGARRKLYADFADTALRQEFIAWGQANPVLYLTDPPSWSG